MIAHPQHRERPRPAFVAALVGLFLLVALSGVLHHEMWRDELHAWMLARDSASLVELFQNLRVEGHPALWHLMLFALSRASPDPLVMQLFHVGIATASVYLVARFSPFGPVQKCLLAFGYFSVYEYALISRSYSLSMLLTFAFCALLSVRHRYPVRVSPFMEVAPFVVLAMLANTTVHGLFISAALALYLLWPQSWPASWPASWSGSRSGMRPGLPPAPRARAPSRWLSRAVGVGLLVAGWLLCFLQVNRINKSLGPDRHIAADLSASGTNALLELADRAASTALQVWRAYVPVPAFWSERPWNSNALFELDLSALVAGQDVSKVLGLLLSVLLFGWVCRLFAGHARVLVAYLAGTALLMAFSFLFLDGMLRHHGYLFILLVACLWLARAEALLRDPPSTRSRATRRQSALLSTLLVFHVVAGACLYVLDWMQPFSGSEATADYLRAPEFDGLPILGYRDREVSTLSGYLDKPIYYLNTEAFGTFWTSRARPDWTGSSEAIGAFMRKNGGRAVVVLTEPMDRPIPGVTLQPLTYVPGIIDPKESFHLYLATAR